MSDLRIGVDVGGTKILAGAVDATGRVAARARVLTPVGVDALTASIAEAVETLGVATGTPIGVAIAGRVDAAGRTLVQAANLSLADVAMADLVEQRLAAPVYVVNDADAAMVAECWVGAAKDCTDAIMVAVGTGVGGAAVAGGRLVAGAHGAAGEIGHMVVKRGGRRCTCGGRGCLDQYGSGRALWRYARRLYRESDAELPVDLGAAADSDDRIAIAAYDRIGLWLGAGVADAAALLDPERIVLAGGVAASTPLLVDAVRRHLQRELQRRGVAVMPSVVRAALGADAAMIGAAHLAPFSSRDARSVDAA